MGLLLVQQRDHGLDELGREDLSLRRTHEQVAHCDGEELDVVSLLEVVGIREEVLEELLGPTELGQHFDGALVVIEQSREENAQEPRFEEWLPDLLAGPGDSGLQDGSQVLQFYH